MKRSVILLLVLAALLLTAAMPVYAAEDYIADDADILSASEEQALEQLALEISRKIGADVHIVTAADYRAYFGSGTVRSCAEEYFTAHDLGRGSDREGILLFLSMKERDYAMIFHGAETIGSFTDQRQINLEDGFLDDFAWDDWYSGMEDFLNGCAHEKQAHKSAMIAVVLLVPLAMAAAACAVMVFGMKTARKQSHADCYIPGGGIQVTQRSDRFINKTVVRRKIETSSSHGGSGGRSGGFSGRSGKF